MVNLKDVKMDMSPHLEDYIDKTANNLGFKSLGKLQLQQALYGMYILGVGLYVVDTLKEIQAFQRSNRKNPDIKDIVHIIDNRKNFIIQDYENYLKKFNEYAEKTKEQK